MFVLTSLAPAVDTASADYLGCGYSQEEFLTKPGCVDTSIVASSGSLLTREDLLRNLALYEHYGFTRDFIENAPMQTIYVTEDIRWSGCDDTPDNGLCEIAGVRDSLMSGLFWVGMPFTVIGDENTFIALMCGNFHPVDVTQQMDAAKTGFHFVDIPTRLDVGVDTPITVEATVTNLGPDGPGHFTDEIRLLAEDDCTVNPASYTVPVVLAAGASTTFSRTFTVNCAHPSDHDFTAMDELAGEVGILDPDLTNNERTVPATIEVFDDSDLAVTSATLTCDDQTQVNTPFTCEGTATLTNDGPFGPTPSSATLSLDALDDCTVELTSGGVWTGNLALNGSEQFTGMWELTCDHRSYHPATMTAAVNSTYNHAEDHTLANNSMGATATTEVFETVDLEASFTQVSCTQREATANDFMCTAQLAAMNNGPATAVQTQTQFVFTPEAGCSVEAQPSLITRQIDANQTVAESATVHVTCDGSARSVIDVEAILSNAPEDPHAVDSDTAAAVWGPLDVKPRSWPSSINLGKQGVTPLAVLGTREFDPFTALQINTLRFGATGTEAVVTCASEGEDVNNDGLLDLICRVHNREIGDATTDTTTLYLAGMLVNGTPFYAEDAVNIVR
ncbi:hypothetical protein H5399_08135 [Tessaracoccus sp. MC1627]|uniref:hypothetical protein n=1 Tax=Tessaracoccus sp. MC1627 TaxID=2760312 RepID=UPI00160438F6|nr:hypothetical protein [Tessaracoccus sp. MC1627]MBB1512570.1 hypothetical protein [Tessaracoccus sp. MC1627]